MNRREFLRKSAAVVAGSLVVLPFAAAAISVAPERSFHGEIGHMTDIRFICTDVSKSTRAKNKARRQALPSFVKVSEYGRKRSRA